MLKEGMGILWNARETTIQHGAKRPLWVASLYPPRKYINAIVIFYIEKLRLLPQSPIQLSFLILGSKVLHILNSFICSGGLIVTLLLMFE